MKVGITSGDPAGIGPEIIFAALGSGKLSSEFDYQVIGATDAFTPGRPERASAEHALRVLEEAVSLAKTGEIQAVVTGPVSKKRMHDAGFAFAGDATNGTSTATPTTTFPPVTRPGSRASRLLDCHRDVQSVFGLDQVVVIVQTEIDLDPVHLTGELALSVVGRDG